jgi:hypothetical protein
MTINVTFTQPAMERSCEPAARAWAGLPAKTEALADALAALYRHLGPFTRVEVNAQILHGAPVWPDRDDHAEYLLRAFERQGSALVAAPLLDTPRTDLDGATRDELRSWIREHFVEIDAGAWVLPDRFLAERAVSVTPRGLARSANRPFATLFGDGSDFADLPFERGRVVKSPRGLLRRLDQGTCPGCHATRSIAGFHLFGDPTDLDLDLEVPAVGRSPHVANQLAWRRRLVSALARGIAPAEPLPYADRPAGSPGDDGDACDLGADPSFAGWRCAAGLRCRDVYHDPDAMGACAPVDGNHEGDPCETASTTPSTGPDGDRVTPDATEDCRLGGEVQPLCSPNGLGFPGGACLGLCATVGVRSDDGRSVCMAIPLTGFEDRCLTAPIPIEECVARVAQPSSTRWCDASHACREDYACLRVPGLPAGEGGCAPPYLSFALRVDGPVLDR